MKQNEGRIRAKILLFYVLIMFSILVQYNFVYKNLKVLGLWHPPLSVAFFLLIVVMLIGFFSAWQGGKADFHGKVTIAIVWITVVIVFFPWIGILLETIVKSLR